MEIILFLVMFIYGTIFSSFFNLVGYRVPLSKSIVSPGSECGDCGTKLRGKDLVPVFSCLLNRGKCRYCGCDYGISHAFLELYVGILYGITSVFILDSFVLFFTIVLLISLYNINRASMMLHGVLIRGWNWLLLILIIILTILSMDLTFIMSLFVFLLVGVFFIKQKFIFYLNIWWVDLLIITFIVVVLFFKG